MNKFVSNLTTKSYVVVEVLPINSVKVSFYVSELCILEKILFPFSTSSVISNINLGDKIVKNNDVVMGPNYVYLFMEFEDYSTYNGTIATL
jgi:hypothetical protein